MKENYNTIYKRIVSAYYNNEFEKTLEDILNSEFESKIEGKEAIAAMCGVDITALKDDALFAYEIIDAITQHKVREKILQKVGSCNKD